MDTPGYKAIPTEHGIMYIPDNLSPEQEAALIAKRLAEFDPVEEAAFLRDVEEMRAHPELCVPFEDILRDLRAMEEEPSQDGK